MRPRASRRDAAWMLRRHLLFFWLAYIAAITLCTYYFVSSHPTFKLINSSLEPVPSTVVRGLISMSEPGHQCSAAVTAGIDGQRRGLDVWIVAGQSNAVGDNWRDTSPLPEASAAAGDTILNFLPEGRWAPAEPNIHFGVHNYTQRDSVGPDMSFGRTLIAEGLAQRVAFIPTAKCNTDLATDWAPDSGTFYTHMLATVHAALQSLTVAAATSNDPDAQPHLMGMIWVQGESDAVAAPASGPSKAEAYKSNLVHFIAKVRTALSPYHPCLPIILGLVSEQQTSPKLPNMHSIRQQQLELSLPALLKVDMDPHEFYQQDGVTLHLSKQGQSSFGREMAQAYKAWRMSAQ